MNRSTNQLPKKHTALKPQDHHVKSHIESKRREFLPFVQVRCSTGTQEFFRQDMDFTQDVESKKRINDRLRE